MNSGIKYVNLKNNVEGEVCRSLGGDITAAANKVFRLKEHKPKRIKLYLQYIYQLIIPDSSWSDSFQLPLRLLLLLNRYEQQTQTTQSSCYCVCCCCSCCSCYCCCCGFWVCGSALLTAVAAATALTCSPQLGWAHNKHSNAARWKGRQSDE